MFIQKVLIALMLVSATTGIANAQVGVIRAQTNAPAPVPAEQRIETYTHEELKVYAQSLVDLSRDQGKIISSLKTDNDALAARITSMSRDIENLQSSVATLDKKANAPAILPKKATKKRKFFDYFMKAAPIVFAGIAAIR